MRIGFRVKNLQTQFCYCAALRMGGIIVVQKSRLLAFALVIAALVFGSNLELKAEQKPLQVNVAAAADLKFALAEVSKAFAIEHPEISVKVVYGSSGNFFAQLSNKAPFDVFLSADMEYPQKLSEQGLAVKSALFQYAVGRIVVWVPNDSKLDVGRLGIKVLLDPSIKKIAIANPQHAPYGKAAEAAMKKLGVFDQVQGKLVFGENVAQAAQYVESGAADVGIIALSLAKASVMLERGKFWEIPLENYPRMNQGGVVLSWAQNSNAASSFCSFLVSKKGRDILKSYGFYMPEN